MNARDWRQRYEGTYGTYVSGDKRLLCRLARITTDGTPTVRFETSTGADFTLVADTEGVEWEFLLPTAGCYNTSKGVLFVTRVAARQFQRGISNHNTIIKLLTAHGTFDPIGVNFQSLSLLKESQEKLMTERVFSAPLEYYQQHGGIALSKNISLLGFNPEQPWVMVHETAISKDGSCSYKDGVFNITLTSDLFLQEVADAFKRNNLKAEIKCQQ